MVAPEIYETNYPDGLRADAYIKLMVHELAHRLHVAMSIYFFISDNIVQVSHLIILSGLIFFGFVFWQLNGTILSFYYIMYVW